MLATYQIEMPILELREHLRRNDVRQRVSLLKRIVRRSIPANSYTRNSPISLSKIGVC
jgi:hypothetical protein